MTKKQKILNKLSEKTWFRGMTQFIMSDFEQMGFATTVEYGEKYGDIIYTRRVLQKAGYKVLLGSYSLCIYSKESEYHN